MAGFRNFQAIEQEERIFRLRSKMWENLVKSIWRMPWHKKTMKDVAACDKFRGGGKQPLIRKFPNGETYPDEVRMSSTQVELENPANWNILVAGGKEKNIHSLSSGERKGSSLNFLNRV